MASAASHVSFLPPVLTFCAAAAVAVPLFRRLGLSAVLGYLAAGVIIGPAGLGLIEDPETTVSVAELGVVLLLFIVGLELNLSHLWSMKRDIFGLGLAQLLVTGAVIAAAAVAMGYSGNAAIAAGIALALSATAIALQMLEESGDLQKPYGRRAFAVLLFQDLSIAPILAILPLLGTGMAAARDAGGFEPLMNVGKAVAAVATVVLIGRYGLNPFFRVLANSGAREVMTASALLVVFGAALLMDQAGLSMAMGAFLAGLLLAESNFRHQLEADIEPFRGILLGLFFMSVGMTIDGGLVRENWLALLVATPVVVFGKCAIVTILFRLFGSPLRDGIRAGAVLSPAGEFAFVLLPLAASLNILPGETSQLVTALAALTMLLGPIFSKALDLIPERKEETDLAFGPLSGSAEDLSSRVLVIGFGRFGQVVNQVLLAQGIDVTVIDTSIDRIRDAGRFGLRVYYGDGTRLDVLRSAGAAKAEMVCVCVDQPETALKIVELLHSNFRQAHSFVRAYDRVHAIKLMNLDVDYQLRETFESAIVFGRSALEELGVEPAAAASVVEDVRKRDIARLVLQKSAGTLGGVELLVGSTVTPEPLTTPTAKARGLSAETRDILGEEVV
jgi:monovalent cation:proton antiporter-2 (CPA2) family protein